MNLYRIKQFIWAITAKVKLEDTKFIINYLNNEEVKLFNKLNTYEKTHSIRVAYDVKKFCEREKIANKNFLIRVALLHDIGKIHNSLNIMQKSIMVILNGLTKGKLKKITKFKIIDNYYNHGLNGYNILKKYNNYDNRFLYLIKNHHNYIKGDKELEIIQLFDSKN